MNRWIRYPLLLSGICVLCPALAAARAATPGVTTVTCPANEDRVWVYDSLTSFDVEAKLQCGDTVEIVSRVKGYVKVRIASGVVGYLPDSVFPDLPPLTDDQDKLGDHNATPVETAAQAPTDEATSLAAAAAAYRARAAHKPAPVVASTVAPPVVAPATQEAVVVTAPKPVATPQPVAVATAPAPAARVGLSGPRRVKSVAAAATAEAKPAVVVTPALTPTAPQIAASATVVPAAPGTMDLPIPAPTAIPAVAAPAEASLREVAAAKLVGTDPESEDYPDTQPEDASADPNCRIFFSAYGLGAEQYKWLSDMRQKQFSGICPAPNLRSVDFVILFTHDSDSYVSAMPTPVHTDGNGFSDFDPMTTVDTALMSPTQADKAHYELAWVFRVKRGGFDPAKFSPRRRPQYTATSKGSHASTKAVEDAFNFIEHQAATR